MYFCLYFLVPYNHFFICCCIFMFVLIYFFFYSICFFFLFFFFKQKPVYEVRISDWSSDVCSSDLTVPLEFVRDRRDVPVTLPLIVPALFRTTLLSPMAVKLPSTVPVAPTAPVAAPPAPTLVSL